MIIISNEDLIKQQWPENILINNIEHLYQHVIMTTQKNLSRDFIQNYLINPKYNKCEEDEITLDILMIYQPL